MGFLSPLLTGLQMLAAVAGILLTASASLDLLAVTLGALLPGRRSLRSLGGKPRLAVVIPAHNEERLIGRCVASVIAAHPEAGDGIFVVADNCSDGTAAQARQAGAEVLVRSNREERGKGFALRYAFEMLIPLGFDAMLVVDADSVVSANLTTEVRRALASGVDVVQCAYRVLTPDASPRTRLMDLALLSFNYLRPLGRSRAGLSAGLLGNAFALTAATLRAVPYAAESVVEDLEYHLLLVSAGKRVVFVPEATVFGEMPSDAAAASSQRSRWEGGRARMAREWAPVLAGRVLRGQLRFLEPLLELMALPLALQCVALAALAVIGPAFARWYAVSAVSIIAAHLGVAMAMGGSRASLLALAEAPLYILWKLSMIPSILRNSAHRTEWVRTEREGAGTAGSN